MSDKNNVVIISDRIRELYADHIKNAKDRCVSDLDNLVGDENKDGRLFFLSFLYQIIDKLQVNVSEVLCCINSFWYAIAIKKRVLFKEIEQILKCLYIISQKYGQKYDDSPELEYYFDAFSSVLNNLRAQAVDINKNRKNKNVKFEVYFNLVDSIYDKYCSNVIGREQRTEHKEIKLSYQILYWASLKSDVKGFRLESFLNFIEKNLKVCNEIDTKLPVLDNNDIYFMFSALEKLIGRGDALSGSEVARIFNLVSGFYKVICTEIKDLILELSREVYDYSGREEPITEVIAVLARVLLMAIENGSVEEIQTKAVFLLVIDLWKVACETKKNKHRRTLAFSVLELVICLLKKKNKSIVKANEKLGSIGHIFDEEGWKLIDENADNAFEANMASYSNLMSEIYEIYGIGELEKGIDNAAPPLMENHDENNGINDGLNYYSDINKDDNNINAKSIKSGSVIKLDEQVQDKINSFLIFSENSKVPEIIQNNNIVVPNKNNKNGNEIDNNHKSQDSQMLQEISLDNEFKDAAIYWFNLFSIVFELISFISLIVAIFSLISLFPSLTPPIFASILKSQTAKLILLGVTLIIMLATWFLSKRLKSKIPCNNSDNNKEIGEERQSYFIEKSKKIVPILGGKRLINQNIHQAK